jgi:hypothetical protein
MEETGSMPGSEKSSSPSEGADRGAIIKKKQVAIA